MNAIIFYLTAFGYIDGDFDFTEKTFVRIYIRQLVTARAKTRCPTPTPKTRDEVVNKFIAHFHEVFEQIDRGVKDLFDEAVADGEDVEKFVYAKLKLRSYEIFQSFDRDNQHELLVDDRRADLRRRQRPSGGEEVPRGDRGAARRQARCRSATATSRSCATQAGRDRRARRRRAPALDDHPFFQTFEQHYSADPERIRQQIAADLDLMHRFVAQLDAAARGGRGQARRQADGRRVRRRRRRSSTVTSTSTRPSRTSVYELTVLGDLHGCYSCLKGALLQADFFAKLEAWKLDTAQARAQARPARRLHRSRQVQLQRRAAHGDAAVPRRARARVPAARQPRVLHRVPRPHLRRREAGRGDQHADRPHARARCSRST